MMAREGIIPIRSFTVTLAISLLLLVQSASESSIPQASTGAAPAEVAIDQAGSNLFTVLNLAKDSLQSTIDDAQSYFEAAIDSSTRHLQTEVTSAMANNSALNNASYGIYPVRGIEFLGAGYDYVFGNPHGNGQGGPDPGFRGQVIKISSDITDLCPDFKSLCPKGVYVRRIHMCDFSSSSEDVSTTSDYQNNLKIDADVSAEYDDGTLNVAFSASVGYNKFVQYTENSNWKSYVSQAQCREYAAFIQPGTNKQLSYTDEFIKAVNALPAYSSSTTKAYETFIRAFGTHILDYIEYGAKYIITTYIKTSDSNSLEEEELDISATLSGSYMDFTGSAQFSYKDQTSAQTEVKKKVQDVTETVLGGYVPTGTDDDKWNRWMTGIADRPFPVRYRYRPVDLSVNFVNPSRGPDMSKALNDYALKYGKIPDTSLSDFSASATSLRYGSTTSNTAPENYLYPYTLYAEGPFANLRYTNVRQAADSSDPLRFKLQYGAPTDGLVPFVTPMISTRLRPLLSLRDQWTDLKDGCAYTNIVASDSTGFQVTFQEASGISPSQSSTFFNGYGSNHGVQFVAARTDIDESFRGIMTATLGSSGAPLNRAWDEPAYIQASISDKAYLLNVAQRDPVILITPGRPDSGFKRPSGNTFKYFTAMLYQQSNGQDTNFNGTGYYCQPSTKPCPRTRAVVRTATIDQNNPIVQTDARATSVQSSFNVMSISQPQNNQTVCGKVIFRNVPNVKFQTSSNIEIYGASVASGSESGITARMYRTPIVSSTGQRTYVTRLTVKPGFSDVPSVIVTPVLQYSDYQDAAAGTQTAMVTCSATVDTTLGYSRQVDIDVICYAHRVLNPNSNWSTTVYDVVVNFNFGIFGPRNA